MKRLLLLLTLLSANAFAYEHREYGFSFKEPDDFAELPSQGEHVHFQKDDLHFTIHVDTFEAPTSLEKWMVKGCFNNSDLRDLTFRKQEYSEEYIDGIRMVRYGACITALENSKIEERMRLCTYFFVHENRGYSVNMVSTGETSPQSALDGIMKSFKFIK